MKFNTQFPQPMTDPQLVSLLRDCLYEERENLVRQLEVIQEIDTRKLFFHHTSLWAFLVDELGFEESVAERKIRASRVMRRIPALKSLFESGKMNLSLLELALSVAYREKLSDEELWEVIQSI